MHKIHFLHSEKQPDDASQEHYHSDKQLAHGNPRTPPPSLKLEKQLDNKELYGAVGVKRKGKEGTPTMQFLSLPILIIKPLSPIYIIN